MKKNTREISVEFYIFGFQENFYLTSFVPKQINTVIFLSSMHNTLDVDEDAKTSLVNLAYNSARKGVGTVESSCVLHIV